MWLLARALAKHEGISQVVVTGRGSELARRLATDRIPTRTPAWNGALDLRALAGHAVGARGPVDHPARPRQPRARPWPASRSVRPGPRLVLTRRVDFPVRRTGFWGRADRIIAISDAVRRALVASGVPRQRR